MKTIVVIVAKEPVAAQVKTRLCPGLSPAQAAEVYALFIQDIVEEMSGIPVKLALAYSPEGAERAFEALLPVPMRLFPRAGRKSWGKTLTHFLKALRRGLRTGPYHKQRQPRYAVLTHP